MTNQDFKLCQDFGLADKTRATLGGLSKARLEYIHSEVERYCETGVMGLSPASLPAFVLFSNVPTRQRTHAAEVVRDTLLVMIDESMTELQA